MIQVPKRPTSTRTVQAERGKHQALSCAPEHGLHHKLSVRRPFRLSVPLEDGSDSASQSGQQNSGPKTARETLRAYAAKIQYCMLLDDSGFIRNRRTTLIRVQLDTTAGRTRMAVGPLSTISAYYSVGIGGT